MLGSMRGGGFGGREEENEGRRSGSAALMMQGGFGGGEGSTAKPVLGEKSGDGSGEDMPTQDFDVWLFRRDAAKMAKVRR